MSLQAEEHQTHRRDLSTTTPTSSTSFTRGHKEAMHVCACMWTEAWCRPAFCSATSLQSSVSSTPETQNPAFVERNETKPRPSPSNGQYPKYGWDFSGKIPEGPRKRSESFSWSSPKPYNSRHLKAPEHFQNSLPPQHGWGRLFLQKWFRRGPLRAGHGIPSSTGGTSDLNQKKQSRYALLP